MGSGKGLQEQNGKMSEKASIKVFVRCLQEAIHAFSGGGDSLGFGVGLIVTCGVGFGADVREKIRMILKMVR